MRNYNIRNKQGWIVAMAALSIDLILGMLYLWRLIQKALVDQWGWTNTQVSVPFTNLFGPSDGYAPEAIRNSEHCRSYTGKTD